MLNPRQLAFMTLRAIYRGGYADVELHQTLQQATLSEVDRRFLTELVYGTVRRQRTLDAWIDYLGKKPAAQQPPDLRMILHLGLYQLLYLNHIPAAAAVDTTVDLARQNKLAGLTGVVNGLLRQSIRQMERSKGNVDPPIAETADPITRLGLRHSYPDWIVHVWQEQLGLDEAEQLCVRLNQSPAIDLRINPLRASLAEVEAALQAFGVAVAAIPGLPQALRLTGPVGAIQHLPGFDLGGWMVQDASAQLVGHLVDPQPGETVIDACAAPGGKTTHLAELMQDQGTIWACDRSAGRLRKVQQNADRLHLQSIQICAGDSRTLSQFEGQADRVLLDAPCSGLGTLHRHADARWRQTPASVAELGVLQEELLHQAIHWVKPGGILVYATCTLHPLENERLIQTFLDQHPDWGIQPPGPDSPVAAFATPEGWVKVWPHRHQMDGFFMARLKKQ
ncbi:16S rRNA (cytosine(967)-C(5))-methyltransferase [Leptolyngbya sp. 'hensonii']|nr:16S rRNA (cytosine(967)-C(5))-methyltransferase [Leptolyngbya sp. 'hensonii']